MASTQVPTKNVGPVGGGGGRAKDMNVNGITRIVKISIRHGAAIDALTVRYLRDGREESTQQWGGTGGNLTEFNLQASEYITSIKGHSGTFNGVFVLRSLKFETNLRSYGSYGKEEGTPFELPAITGQIIGFYARAGAYLDALGVYVKASTQVPTKIVGPVGGGGGVAKDMNVNGVTRIVKISIRHGSVIDALTVHYLRDGREESTQQWGGTGGNLTEFNLQASEYITSVKGHISNFYGVFVLRSLKFETNLRSYGSYGKEEGTPFELPAITGQIIGFHGRSGAYLDALGVYVKAPIQVPTKNVGPVGGGGGVATDMNVNGITRIVKISIRHGVAIDSLTVRYLRDGREESTQQWGGRGGNLTEFNLQASEYITSVKGHIGTFNGVFVLRSLKFVTNLRSYGSYGEEEGTPFELPAITGQIIGFHGRSGAYLDSLGVYVKANNTMGGVQGGDGNKNTGKPGT